MATAIEGTKVAAKDSVVRKFKDKGEVYLALQNSEITAGECADACIELDAAINAASEPGVWGREGKSGCYCVYNLGQTRPTSLYLEGWWRLLGPVTDGTAARVIVALYEHRVKLTHKNDNIRDMVWRHAKKLIAAGVKPLTYKARKED